MSKIKSKVILSTDVINIENDVNKWLDNHPDIYIIDTCNVGVNATAIFYGIKSKSQSVRENPNEDPKCPKCHRTMVIRSSNKTGELFWGCSKYPDCVSSLPFTEEDFDRKYPPEEFGRSTENSKDNDDIPF